MDRPIANENQGQLTDEEFGILKAADDRMRIGKATHPGWWRFKEYDGAEWQAVKVVSRHPGRGDSEKLFLEIGFDRKQIWVNMTFACQWAGEIRMPEDGK